MNQILKKYAIQPFFFWKFWTRTHTGNLEFLGWIAHGNLASPVRLYELTILNGTYYVQPHVGPWPIQASLTPPVPKALWTAGPTSLSSPQSWALPHPSPHSSHGPLCPQASDAACSLGPPCPVHDSLAPMALLHNLYVHSRPCLYRNRTTLDTPRTHQRDCIGMGQLTMRPKGGTVVQRRMVEIRHRYSRTGSKRVSIWQSQSTIASC